MYRATFQRCLDDPWRFMEPIRVGSVPTGEPEPQHVTVERDSRPVARIDAYADHNGPFTELITWVRFVVLGWDAVVYGWQCPHRSCDLIFVEFSGPMSPALQLFR